MSQHLLRLRRIIARQDKNRFGDDYRPAIRAVREEAPGTSRPTILESVSEHRHYHLMSLPERGYLLLALFHPRVIEVQEQRLLHLDSMPHPLDGHPTLRVDRPLPMFRGTLKVASAMGELARHPKFSFKNGDGRTVVSPAPLVADLLLFLRGEPGSSNYCVNWSVKQDKLDFTRAFRASAKRAERSRQQQEFRHALEDQYYLDCGIPTYHVAGQDLPKQLTRNLLNFYVDRLDPPPNVTDSDFSDLVSRLIAAAAVGRTPGQVYRDSLLRSGLTLEAFRWVLAEAIWRHQLRVDLFRPVVMDAPLRPEREDPHSRYAKLFMRS